MRFGGGTIQVDIDKDPDTVEDRQVMRSSFFIMDITNPEKSPELLGEISFPGLGYTTCSPAVIPVKTEGGKDWYLVFGSGPKGESGIPGTRDRGLTEAVSEQPAKLYVIDLMKLACDRELWALNSSGTFRKVSETDPEGMHIFQKLDDDAFVSDPVSVDFNLDSSIDVLYFGTTSGDKSKGWSGKLRRIILDNNSDATQWNADSVLYDLSSVEGKSTGKSISTAPVITVDPEGNRWVYFGTGRRSVLSDLLNTDQQAFYGIRDMDWETVTDTELIEVSGMDVFEDGYVTEKDDLSAPQTWLNLKTAIAAEKGWQFSFESEGSEKTTGQAALMGDMLTFNTYQPSTDTCSFSGSSYMYALHYLTGTPYFEPSVGLEDDGELYIDEETGPKRKMTKKISIGNGLAISPDIHTGREKGSKVFIQTSSGFIRTLHLFNPGRTKSGMSSWKEIEMGEFIDPD